uniref:S-adenosylmethionine decarboxylase proenzyme n=1 Tax=Aceria tosichella TaxID=561515 RepID=A0A6G1SK17_9ACAR
MEALEHSKECNFYEGTEKLLEIWFTKTDSRRIDNCDLRKIQRAALESLLKFARCQILSMRRTEHFDGYVLSESSMFIYKERIILKTCGQTTLLNCIEPLLYLAREVAGFDEILDVFYSRKNFMRPELQEKMHSSFDHEIEMLDAEFELGSAYCMGKLNKDCWYLYTLHPEHGVTQPDQTLELIMVDLDEKIMSNFCRPASSSAREATQKSGIDRLFPNMQVDDFLFDPCGYSMNGFLRSGHYVTIHVTPEPEFSYVSFETNAPQASYMELISKILRLFSPTKFIMTIFANEASMAYNHLHEYKSTSFAGYQIEENQFTRFKNYELTYGNYCREAG